MCDTVFTVSYEQCILFRDSGEPKTAERNCEGKLFKNEANTFSVKDEDLLDVITVSACVCKKKTKKKIPQQEQCTHYRKDAGSEIPQYGRIFDSACSDC